MDLNRIVDRLKAHQDYTKMGMIAGHLGVVRGNSLEGGNVKAIEVTFDEDAISRVIGEIKKMPGIVEVVIETCGGRLEVGEEIMAVVVGGDTREHVFPALIAAVDRIKKEASNKREIF